MHETGHSKPVQLGQPEGWGGEGGGRGVQDGETHVHPWFIHVNVWQKPLQYCKVISLQLQYIYKFLKKELEDVQGARVLESGAGNVGW